MTSTADIDREVEAIVREIQVLWDRFTWGDLPYHTVGILKRYVFDGAPPGAFGYAVLTNDLMRSFAHADDANSEAMPEICRAIYNGLPAACHGTPAKVQHWINIGGARGHARELIAARKPADDTEL